MPIAFQNWHLASSFGWATATLLSILLSMLLSLEILEAPLKRLSVRYFADVALKNHQEVCKAIYIRLADKTHLSCMLFNEARPLRLG